LILLTGMKVYVNDNPVEIFEGARVCDALNKYSGEQSGVFNPGLIRISDYHGNIVFLDGSMSENDRIFITYVTHL
jgi:sulfur carrier protein ThiS